MGFEEKLSGVIRAISVNYLRLSLNIVRALNMDFKANFRKSSALQYEIVKSRNLYWEIKEFILGNYLK